MPRKTHRWGFCAETTLGHMFRPDLGSDAHFKEVSCLSLQQHRNIHLLCLHQSWELTSVVWETLIRAAGRPQSHNPSALLGSPNKTDLYDLKSIWWTYDPSINVVVYRELATLNKPMPTASAKDSVSIECRALAPHPALDSMFVLICEWFPVQPDCVSSLSGCDELTVGGMAHLGGNFFLLGALVSRRKPDEQCLLRCDRLSAAT